MNKFIFLTSLFLVLACSTDRMDSSSTLQGIHLDKGQSVLLNVADSLPFLNARSEDSTNSFFMRLYNPTDNRVIALFNLKGSYDTKNAQIDFPVKTLDSKLEDKPLVIESNITVDIPGAGTVYSYDVVSSNLKPSEGEKESFELNLQDLVGNSVIGIDDNVKKTLKSSGYSIFLATFTIKTTDNLTREEVFSVSSSLVYDTEKDSANNAAVYWPKAVGTSTTMTVNVIATNSAGDDVKEIKKVFSFADLKQIKSRKLLSVEELNLD